MVPCGRGRPTGTVARWPTAPCDHAAGRSPAFASPTSAGWASGPSRPGCSPTSVPRSSRSRTATRLDTPRKLPIYKGEVRSQLRRGGPDPDPEQGRAVQQLLPQQARRHHQHAHAEGPGLADRLIRHSSVVTENFAPGVMERWGLTYERLSELSPGRHLRADERLRPLRPARTSTAATARSSRRSAACRSSAACPAREPSGWGLSYMDNQAAYYNSAALLMAILHRGTSPARAPRSTCRPSRRASTCSAPICSTSPSTAAPPGGPTSRPATGSSTRTPRRTASIPASARIAGSRSPCSTTTQWARPRRRHRATRHGRPMRGSRPRRTASRTRTRWTSTSPAWTRRA